MFVSRTCLWLLLAVPAWSISPGQTRLHIPVWDVNDLYSRITNVFKKQPQSAPVVDESAIDDYYNNFWENYYFNNPPVVEYVPRPTRRPTTTRRPRRSTTTTTSSTTSSTTRSTTTTTTTPPPVTVPSTTAPVTDPPTTMPPNTTGVPIFDNYVISSSVEDYDAALQPEQKLSVKKRPQSVSSLCRYHPKLCDQPEEAHFVELTDGNGHPLILISPATTTRRPKRPLALKPTRRYQNQMIFNKKNRRNRNKGGRGKPKTRGNIASYRMVPGRRVYLNGK